MSKKIKKELREWIICFVVAYIIYLLINYFIGTISGIRQISMYPTAKEGEKVVISRRIFWNKKLKKGDIVTVEAPISADEKGMAIYEQHNRIGWFIYNIIGIGKTNYIKRVIALEGEHLYISEQGEVYINDEKLDETYLTEATTPRIGSVYDIIIPKGHVFLMGDNRTESKDSRVFGAVPVNKVNGKVKIRIWPLNKMGAI